MTKIILRGGMAFISLLLIASCSSAALEDEGNSLEQVNSLEQTKGPELIERLDLKSNTKTPETDTTKVKMINHRQSVYVKMEALVGGASCKSDAHCASLPVGNAACGGPANYMVYSTTIGDEAVNELSALATQTKELDIAIAKLDQASGNGVMGICRYNTPSDVACVNNVCKAVANEIIR